MLRIFQRLPSVFAAVLLLGAGMIIGLGIVQPGTTSAATIYTRSTSCAGLDFYPTDSDTQYNNSGTRRYRSGIGGTGVFRCDPKLPNGAVVTKVQFTLFDFSFNQEVAGCGLVRSGLAVATALTAQSMASVPGTGVTLQTAEPLRLSDTTIDNATVDNANWGYWFECQLNQYNDSLGIFGADVIYRISSTKG